MQIKHFLIAYFLGIGLMAHATASQMIVELKTGEKFSFLLNEKPVVTFSADNFIVNGNKSTSYAIDDVKSYYFIEKSLSETSLEKSQSLLVVSVGENTIEISNAEPDANLLLINANGRILASTSADGTGTATLQLPKAKGIYILSTGRHSFKIIRK